MYIHIYIYIYIHIYIPTHTDIYILYIMHDISSQLIVQRETNI